MSQSLSTPSFYTTADIMEGAAGFAVAKLDEPSAPELPESFKQIQSEGV
jgi:hypothetical protein